MNISDNKKVEGLLQFQLMTQMLKQVAGDSDSFSLIMESLTKAMSDENGNIDFSKFSLGEEDLSKLGYGAGERLNAIYKDIKTDTSSGNVSIDAAVEKVARKYGVDKSLILAVIKQESAFNPKATSSAGAMGLMQLMPGTASGLGVSDPYDIEQNVDGGTEYLRKLLDLYGNRKELALAAYNAGPGTLQNRGVKSAQDIYKLPYETRDYVQKVMKYYGGK